MSEIGDKNEDKREKFITNKPITRSIGRFCKGNLLFLSNDEIKNIKEYVPQAIWGVSHLVIIENENNQPIAFMGIEDRKLEMLFIRNSERGKRLGKNY